MVLEVRVVCDDVVRSVPVCPDVLVELVDVDEDAALVEAVDCCRVRRSLEPPFVFVLVRLVPLDEEFDVDCDDAERDVERRDDRD